MKKAEVLEAIKRGRAEWDTLLAEVGTERMLEPGVEGDWTVKDIIAHNTWNELEMARILGDHALLPSESDRLWMMSNDDRNAELYRMYKDKPLDEVLSEADQVYRQLLAVMEPLDDEDMVNPARYPGMPADWEPWRIIAGCTFTHYPDHMRDIRKWLDAKEGKAS
jgi:hypothetical protein